MTSVTKRLYILLGRKIDIEKDRDFIISATRLSVDKEIHYLLGRTSDGDNHSWAMRYIDIKAGLETKAKDELLNFAVVSSVIPEEQFNASCSADTDNAVCRQCLRTGNSPATQYWNELGIWPEDYIQGFWDSSAMVCMDYAVWCPGWSGYNTILSIGAGAGANSRVTMRVAETYFDQLVIDGDLLDTTNYENRYVLFPVREDAAVYYFSLHRYKAKNVSAAIAGAYYDIAFDVMGWDGESETGYVDLSSLTEADGHSAVYTGSNNMVVIAGACHQLHWSADSSDGQCVNADYVSGEKYIPAATGRSDLFGWNTENFQTDSTVNTGFYRPNILGSPLYPALPTHRMVWGTGETLAFGLYHTDLGGDGLSNGLDDEVEAYNAGTHPVFSRNMDRILGQTVSVAEMEAYDEVTDWSLTEEYHFPSTIHIGAGRWNDQGMVGQAPGVMVEPRVTYANMLTAAEYGIIDTISLSLRGNASVFGGTANYYDINGDSGLIPVGSIANSITSEYLLEHDVWPIAGFWSNEQRYHTQDGDLIRVGAVSVWDNTSGTYTWGEGLTFVTPVPHAAASEYVGDDGQGTFREFSGQSSSIPNAAGAITVFRERRPELNYFEAKQVLVSSCRKYPGMEGQTAVWDPRFGYGRPDLVAAANTDLTAAGCPPPTGFMVDGAGTALVLLKWNNPAGYDHIEEIRVVRNATAFPTDHNDGEIIYSGLGNQTHDQAYSLVNYYYGIFAKNIWGDWSPNGIGFTNPIQRQTKCTFTMDSYSFPSSTNVNLYGTLTHSGNEDSTVLPNPLSAAYAPTGQGWYLVNSDSAKNVLPLNRTWFDLGTGVLSYLSSPREFIDVDSLNDMIGKTFNVDFLTFHSPSAEGDSEQQVVPLWPRESVELDGASSSAWFTEFNPYLTLDTTTAINDINQSYIKLLIGNIRNPMGIKDVKVFRLQQNETPDPSDFSDIPNYNLYSDSTSLSTFDDLEARYGTPVFHYKILPVSLYDQTGTELYAYKVISGAPEAPSISVELLNGYLAKITIAPATPTNQTFNIQRNGVVFATIESADGLSAIDFYDYFWSTGDAYKVYASREGFLSEDSNSVTLDYPGLSDALTLEDYVDPIVTVGDLTWEALYDEGGINLLIPEGSTKFNDHKFGQLMNIEDAESTYYRYRTDIIAEQWGGKTYSDAIAAQFELWDAKINGNKLLKFQANPVEYEFEFGVRSNSAKVLDGPDKMQLLYQDHTLRRMIWKSLPLERFRKFIGQLQRFVGLEVWLDAKDFSMPLTDVWPFVYMTGYRTKIKIVAIDIDPVESKGTQRADITLKYKLISSSESGVI